MIEEGSTPTSSRKYSVESNGSEPSQIGSSDEPGVRPRRDAAASGGNIFSSFKKIFSPGAININDSFNRTSTFCVSASLPTREVAHWVNNEYRKEKILLEKN